MDSVGRVESVRNEICYVVGVVGGGLGNVVQFSSGAMGMVLGFNRSEIEVIMFNGFANVKKGDLVRVVASRLTTRVNASLLGRVIDPLGTPLDGKGELELQGATRLPVESIAKPLYERATIETPLVTGYSIIDSQIPIGMGQRELLLGEKKSGQTDVAIDIMCNQARMSTGVINVYVAIDAETAATKRRVERLARTGALENSVVVVARSSQPVAISYIAPMVGTTIAEWFAMQGKNVLIVYDDLTRHAKAYRQISLLLDRPASREAYPGDIFYLHSRLLERSGAFNERAGSGTITALPLVETQNEEATDYITTNLMSITDGHVLFRQTLANKGVQPPIDSGFSVSRIGGRAQLKLTRALSEKLKEIVIMYEEILRFLSFGGELGEASRKAYEIGTRAIAIFQQDHHVCYSALEQAVLMYFVVSNTATHWGEQQMPEVCAYLTKKLNAPPYDDIFNRTVLSMPYEHAEVMLHEFMDDLLNDPNSPDRMKEETFVGADIESVDSILRDDEDVLK